MYTCLYSSLSKYKAQPNVSSQSFAITMETVNMHRTFLFTYANNFQQLS